MPKRTAPYACWQDRRFAREDRVKIKRYRDARLMDGYALCRVPAANGLR